MSKLWWKCGCGKVKLELSAQPWNVGNCHCHSCVASARFLDQKYNDDKNHVSQIDSGSGGASGAWFMPNEVTVLTKDSELGVLKVGPKGKAVRKYAKCCGSQVGVVHKAFWGLSLTMLYEDGGCTKKYVHGEPLANAMAKFAFEPDKIPEPKYSLGPLRTVFKLLYVVVNPFGPSTEKETLDHFDVDPEKADEVPITWE